MNDTTPTAVIFRKWRDGSGIIALFPEVPGTNNGWTCSSYESASGHATACADLSANDSRGVTTAATPAEYRDTYDELVRIGYILRVVKRRTRAMDNKRWEEIRRVRAA